MIIQTMSIVVPTKNRCVNNCKFCVSKTHTNDYEDRFKCKESEEYLLYKSDIRRRFDYAKLHNVDTIILTGTGEALQNVPYLLMVDEILKEMNNPFPRIELQTSGVMLTDVNLHILRQMGISTISLSISDVFNDESNLDIMEVHPKLQFKLDDICKKIKDKGFNLRLSLNMTSVYNHIKNPVDFFDRFKELGANQITFREMYYSNNDTEEDKWIKDHPVMPSLLTSIKHHIQTKGKAQYVLPFGATVYSIYKMSTVVDDDCMDDKSEVDDILKYLILREDGKLYTDWGDEGSLIF
jgi:sulfatase maturation enzyme AslB (radical SAM superfamily)